MVKQLAQNSTDLKPTERRLLTSNKVNRKTILLDQMHARDVEAQGGTSEVPQMQDKGQQLIRKLG